MDILDLLRSDGSIVINKKLAHEIGLDCAVIYSELVSLFKYWSDKGELVNEKLEQSEDARWFFCTIENLQANTTLKRSRQDKAIKELKMMGLIDTRQMGIPKKRYFTITNGILKLLKVAHKSVENQHSDNDAGSEGEKELKSDSNPRGTQSVENQHSVVSKSNTLDSRNSTTNNTRTNNTKINKLKDHHQRESKEDYIELFISEHKMTDDELKLFQTKILSCKAKTKDSVFKYCKKTLETVKEQMQFKNKGQNRTVRVASRAKVLQDDQQEQKQLDNQSEVNERKNAAIEKYNKLMELKRAREASKDQKAN